MTFEEWYEQRNVGHTDEVKAEMRAAYEAAQGGKVVWQYRDMSDLRQPGYWTDCTNTAWAMTVYAMPDHTWHNGFQVRKLRVCE